MSSRLLASFKLEPRVSTSDDFKYRASYKALLLRSKVKSYMFVPMLFREEGGHRIWIVGSISKMVLVTMVSSRENCMIVGPVPIFFRLYASLKSGTCFGISDGERIFAFCNPPLDKSTYQHEEGNYEAYQPLYERSLLSCIPHMIAGVDQSISAFLIKIFIEFGGLFLI